MELKIAGDCLFAPTAQRVCLGSGCRHYVQSKLFALDRGPSALIQPTDSTVPQSQHVCEASVRMHSPSTPETTAP